MIDLSDDGFDSEIGGGHATNLDGLDKDQIMKMIDAEVDGFNSAAQNDFDYDDENGVLQNISDADQDFDL